jgi:hypothetical protein
MCKICTKEYTDDTANISCCSNINEIPYLPYLMSIYYGKNRASESPNLPDVMEFPKRLPNLQLFNCSGNKKIMKLPVFPNLFLLVCRNTNITEIPYNIDKLNFTLDCSGCDWLELSYRNKEDFHERIRKLILIQKYWKQKRWNRMKEYIPLINDIKENCIKLYKEFLISCSLAPSIFKSITCLPSLKNRKVGRQFTSYLLETLGSSTSTVQKNTFVYSLSISCRIGLMRLHGPHQVA